MKLVIKKNVKRFAKFSHSLSIFIVSFITAFKAISPIMLKFLFALKVLFGVYFYGANGVCYYPFEAGRLIFYQNAGPFHFLLPGMSNLPENQAIKAHCSWGFEKLGRYYHDENASDESFTFKCSSDQFHMWHPTRGYYTHDNFQIKCPREIQRTFTQAIAGCRKSSLIKADSFEEIRVTYAEVCYDFNRKKLDFVHFVVADRSPILEDQEQYNPSPVITLAESLITVSSFKGGPRSRSIYIENMDMSYPNFIIVQYGKQSLLPHNNFSPYLPNPNLGPEVEILWWLPLRHGNWYIYEKLAKKRARTEDLDIYAGASHDIFFNGGDKCVLMDILDLEIGTLEQEAPLYIWNYVRPRNTSYDEGFVLVGLNIPFYDVSKSNYTNICTDICDSVDWLKPLAHTRKMPALGYVFCCSVDEVKNILFGFPTKTAHLSIEESSTPLTSTCEGDNC